MNIAPRRFELVGGLADGQTVLLWTRPYRSHVDRGGERYYICRVTQAGSECGVITYRTVSALRALIVAHS